MNSSLTLDMFFELPQKVLDISNEYNCFASMISEDICNDYNINDIKTKLEFIFSKFNSIKFYYNVPIEKILKTPRSINDGIKVSSKESISEKVIDKKIDNMIWAKDFYLSVINLSKGLTHEEAYYLSYHLIAHKSHEVVAEDLNISLRSIQKIKKSCLLKCWIALSKFYEED